jgi:tRNA pseudouridine55 synthase
MILGILNVNKPSGMSSRQAVDCIKRLVRPAKVGHAGTLDPLATGVLVVCIGKATRLIEFVQQMPKRYRATFLLGRTSATEDIEGAVEELIGASIPTRHALEQAARRFVGTIQQVPPQFSALKVNGRRAYSLARLGKRVELAPRPVTVFDLDITEYVYPRVTLDIQCSGGTYVRSLGRDLAESVGTAAVMSELVRTEIGPFHIDNAVDLDRLTNAQLHESLQRPQAALVGLPHVVLHENEIHAVAQGRFLTRPHLESAAESALLTAVDPSGRMVAVLKRRNDDVFYPYINFVGRG